MSQPATTAGPLSYGVAARAAPGEQESGDQAIVAPGGDGVLVGVVDGLGHGPDAAAAAASAVAVLATDPGQRPTDLLRRCHDELHRTRGAAISLAAVTTAGALEWVAVGNVQGAVVHTATATTSRLVTRGGVVGLRLPTIRATTVTLGVGDLLVLFTDGVDDRAARNLSPVGDAQRIAEDLLDRHANGVDDALILVARYDGAQP